jgi:F-type H+/Na+-transporting ATPase subunit beta
MQSPIGTIVSVRGAVVDVLFGGTLPAIETALTVAWDRPEPLVLEVHSHLNLGTVRAVALQPTAGLKRGTAVRTLFVGLAMIETMAIYCLVIALLLLFANPLLK